MSDERAKALEDRITNQLLSEGYTRTPVYESLESGIGDPKSFFDVLFDLRLEGREVPTAQELWTEMKKQLNFAQRNLFKASDDYRKIQNKVRHQEGDIKERIQELPKEKINSSEGLEFVNKVYFKEGKVVLVKNVTDELLGYFKQLGFNYSKTETVSVVNLTDKEKELLK